MTLLYPTIDDLKTSIKDTRSDYKVLLDVFAAERNDYSSMSESGFEGRFAVVKPLPKMIFDPIALIEKYDPVSFLNKLISIALTTGTYLNSTAVIDDPKLKRNQHLIVRMDVDAYLDRELEFLRKAGEVDIEKLMGEDDRPSDNGQPVNDATLNAILEVEKDIQDRKIKEVEEVIEEKRQLYTFFLNEVKSLLHMQQVSRGINFIEIL